MRPRPPEDPAAPPVPAERPPLDRRARFHRNLIVAVMLLFVGFPVLAVLWLWLN